MDATRLSDSAGHVEVRTLRTRCALWALVGLLLVAALGGLVLAQEGNRLSVDQVVVSRDGKEIAALASVLNATGQPIEGLIDFRASVDGAAAEPLSVQPVVSQQLGIAVVLLIDVSGSMSGEPLAQAKAAADAFVQDLLPQDVAAVVAFAKTAPIDSTFTGNPNALRDQIEALKISNEPGTVLYDAVFNGLSIAVGAPTTRRAIVLLTDGKDSGSVSQHTREEVLNVATSAGLPIFAIGLGDAPDAEFLQALSQNAGGRFLEAKTPADIPSIFNEVGATLRSQYAIRLPLSPAATPERELVLRVDVDGETLTARASFRAEAAIEPQGDSTTAAWLFVLPAVVALLGVASVGVFLLRRRRRLGLAGGPGTDSTVSLRKPGDSPIAAAALGSLRLVDGPNAGIRVSLASGPVDIGSDPSCGLQLDTAERAVAATHARVWLQSGRLMVHHLARGHQTIVAGKPIDWATLEPGDTFQVGSHLISFDLDS